MEKGKYIIKGMADETVYIIADGQQIAQILDPRPSQKLVNHSPDGFAWGYAGSGPSQLALAILMLELTDELVLKYYQQFKFDVIANLPRSKGFELPSEKVEEWINANVEELKA